MDYISLGCSCATAFQIKELNLRNNSFPFDWCKISIKQLNLILQNNFNNFNKLTVKKWSSNHNSYLLLNYYKCIFAHELFLQYTSNDLSILENKIYDRIEKFKKCKNPTFIRFENTKKKKDYEFQLKLLILNLQKYFNNFKLILILPKNYNITEFNNVHKIIIYDDYDSDWKYNNIEWNLIK